MASNARLAELAQTISNKTKIVTDYLAEHGLAAPSWDVNGAVDFPIPESAGEAYAARVELIAATKELHDLTLGPKQGLSWLSWDVSVSCIHTMANPLTDKFMNNLSLQAMWEFRVAEFVPLEGAILFDELTDKVVAANGFRIGAMNLRRLVRHAMLNHIFVEPAKGLVAHTSVSRLLRDDEPMANWIGYMCRDLWLPATRVVDAMKKWPASEEPTETAVNLAFGQSLPWYDFLQSVPEKAKRYNLAMKLHSGNEGFSVRHTVSGYPWGDLGDATVVDVSSTPSKTKPVLTGVDGGEPRFCVLRHCRGIPPAQVHCAGHGGHAQAWGHGRAACTSRGAREANSARFLPAADGGGRRLLLPLDFPRLLGQVQCQDPAGAAAGSAERSPCRHQRRDPPRASHGKLPAGAQHSHHGRLQPGHGQRTREGD